MDKYYSFLDLYRHERRRRRELNQALRFYLRAFKNVEDVEEALKGVEAAMREFGQKAFKIASARLLEYKTMTSCYWYSGNTRLKCTVNPGARCVSCNEYQVK